MQTAIKIEIAELLRIETFFFLNEQIGKYVREIEEIKDKELVVLQGVDKVQRKS